MRIVGGTLKGKRLEVPDGRALRPTSDRARESLFNLLTQGRIAGEFAGGGNPLIGARVLDAFAGTGALGIEALSRGAGRAFFMEMNAEALAVLRRNLKECGLEGPAQVIPCDVTHPPGSADPCDIVLADPPYDRELSGPALAALAQAGWIGPGSLVVMETARGEELSPPPGFDELDRRRYGKAQLTFLRYSPA